MLRRLKKPQHQAFAETAAKENAPAGGVGKFLGIVDEGSSVTSYRFEGKLEGYKGWEWNVVVFQGKKPSPPTVSEIVLLPGKESIVAPEWVPWSDRRAELDKSLAVESAVSNLEEPEDTKADSEDAGERPPIGKRLRKRLIKKQDANKGKKPRKGSK
ncbi:unannotated protein [freshwater metagenome]|uniref:Unannotated protein n=1 Tax=freshwater metagenome TaxID=449393 RepID=A0A6J6J340_9ZZZZ|nr:DUF3027 domain-containing protein [Actinomycetota bacterium]